MIVTETEAQSKWCPHARVPYFGLDANGVGSVNRDIPEAPALNNAACLGSQCMAWRWWRWRGDVQPKPEWQSTATGFCGLGTPVVPG